MEVVTIQKSALDGMKNDKSPVMDEICKSLATSGTEMLFQSKNIKNGIFPIISIKKPPQVCVIDLDFYSKNILQQLQELRTQYPTIKLIVHSDIDNEKVGIIGFDGYLLIGSDKDD